MLTKLTVRNFKRLASAEIDLADTVVFIGPNNSGKTTALQALALWDLGLRRWAEKRKDSTAKERTGVTINRRDLIAIPVPNSRLLWRDLHVREVERENGGQKTSNIKFELAVEGVSQGRAWRFGLEFDYANEESFYCRALDWPADAGERAALLQAALEMRVAFLPPMSGLAAQEYRKEPGEIGVLVGEGRTAEVLRNLCHRLEIAADGRWDKLVERVDKLFHVRLNAPEYVPERSELRQTFRQDSQSLDISCSGRGFQQTVLLMAHLYLNPRAVLLLDEPDAHLEVVRQRETYNLLTEVAAENGSQIVAASHSEVVLNEAAERDVVVAFVGSPHRIDNRQRSQASKALKTISFDLYYQAERRGWMFFVEGSTDLAILRALAAKIAHPATEILSEPPVHYIKNNIPSQARDVFHGLREACPRLVGLALFDRLSEPPEPGGGLDVICWRAREIENYLVTPGVLDRFATHDQPDDLFGRMEIERRRQIMREEISKLESALKTQRKPDPWSSELKVTDEFLDPLFRNYFDRLGLPQLFLKRNYHALAALIEPAEMNPDLLAEVREKLDALMTVSQSAQPSF